MDAVRPDGFIFENVTGILNFEKGSFFPRILDDLGSYVESIKVNKVNAANFGVPQRRERVIVIGSSEEVCSTFELKPVTRIDVRTKSVSRITNQGTSDEMPLIISVKEALDDLPEVKAGENAERQPYPHDAANNYQRIMRGEIDVEDYLADIRTQSKESRL